MFKASSPLDWYPNELIVSLIKVASGGLRGEDRRQFIKRAGLASQALIDAIDQGKVKLAEGEVPVHAIAVGDYERFSHNRNGDSFDGKTCRDRHHTFTKFAKWFRHHDHTPTSPSYGRIAGSAYSPVSGRIDVLAALNGTKEAAERNGGFVADEEMTELEAGRDIPVSMGARVPIDKCDYCGNEAPSRKYYCTAATCKAGGCVDNLGKVVKVGGDLHHLGVLNPNATWFDLSKVGKPAAPYAYAQRADWAKTAADLFATAADAADAGAVKVASADGHPAHASAADAAESARAFAAVLAKLAEEDARFPLALPRSVPPSAHSLAGLGLADPRPHVVKAACRALADQWVVLPLADFAEATGRGEHVKFAKYLTASAAGEARLARNPYAAAGTATAAQKTAALDVARSRTVRPSLYAVRMAERGPEIKAAATLELCGRPALGREAEALAADYAAYKTAALLAIRRAAGADFPAACRIAVAL